MAIQITLGTFGTLTNASILATLNANNTLLQNAFLDCVSLSGSTPNSMASNLDMNGFNIINLPNPSTINSPVRVQDVSTTDGITASFVGLLAGANIWTAVNTFNSTVKTIAAGSVNVGGNPTPGVTLGSIQIGIYYGSGAPTISGTQGGLYLRTDGTTAYINTNGSTAWTALGALTQTNTWSGTNVFNGSFSGTGVSALLASPPPIGGSAAAAGSFTTLTASSTVSGAGVTSLFASPPAIGGTAAAAGSFTTLSASSTVSGAGFSTYLASPPAIGGTSAAAGTFTAFKANTGIFPNTASNLGSAAITALSSDSTGSTYSARFGNSSAVDVFQVRGDSVVVVVGTLTNIGSGGISAGSGGVTTGKNVLITSTTNFTNNAAAQTATMTNGPTAGNPTKWIPINDNGTTRNIPAW